MSELAKHKAMQEEQFSDKIVEEYAPLVKRIANHLLGRLPANIQLDDLMQSGMIGLLDAALKYDANKGASFETYAGIRIRGMMLDEVRRNDWAPRSVYRSAREISELVRKIENKEGRDAKDHEVAEGLGISLQEYHRRLVDFNNSRLHGYNDVANDEQNFHEGLNGSMLGPYEAVHICKFNGYLSEMILTLPEREKLVLALYYDGELNLKKIGEVLGVSESRVCQIHSQAMIRLKARMTTWDG